MVLMELRASKELSALTVPLVLLDYKVPTAPRVQRVTLDQMVH